MVVPSDQFLKYHLSLEFAYEYRDREVPFASQEKARHGAIFKPSKNGGIINIPKITKPLMFIASVQLSRPAPSQSLKNHLAKSTSWIFISKAPPPVLANFNWKGAVVSSSVVWLLTKKVSRFFQRPTSSLAYL